MVRLSQKSSFEHMKIGTSAYFVWPPKNDPERFPTAVKADGSAKLGFVVTCHACCRKNGTPQIIAFIFHTTK